MVARRIFKANASLVGASWMWTMLFDYCWPTHGYEATRETAVAAFAKSWRCSGIKLAKGSVTMEWWIIVALAGLALLIIQMYRLALREVRALTNYALLMLVDEGV